MAQVASAYQLYLVQKARFARVGRKIDDAMRWIAEEGRRDLVELTSGNISARTLRLLGHPYARGERGEAGSSVRRRVDRKRAKRLTGRAVIPPFPINVQRGALRSRIFLKRVGRHIYELGSAADAARYQFSPWGTVKMIRRGVMGGRALNLAFPPGQLELRWRMRTRVVRDAVRSGFRS